MERRNKFIELFKSRIVPQLNKKYKIKKIYLFGSSVSGTFSENSDLDVILISNDFSKIPFIKRMGTILQMIEFPIHIDFFCYTEKEFKEIKETSIIISNGLKEAIKV